MKGFFVHAVMIGALTAPAAYASAGSNDTELVRPGAVAEGEGAAGGRGVRRASAADATFLFVPGVDQSSQIVPVGEGGEGKKGRRWRQQRLYHSPYTGRRYHYRSDYQRDWNEGYFERRTYDRPYYYQYRPY
jgi:hypothetical protein